MMNCSGKRGDTRRANNTVRIAEIYQSIQGEGRLTGTESVFVRASGCNLRCWFCDTPYASWEPEGEDLSVDEIARQILQFDCPHAVITGGEPMLFAELIPLCERLKEVFGLHITIETAGTLYLPVACDLMSISPKLSSSTPSEETAGPWAVRHERTRHAPKVTCRLVAEYDYQIKFVIESPADCEEAEEYLRELPAISREAVWLMPQGTEAAHLHQIGDWLQPYCRQRGYHYCPRRQIEWFGLVRGT